MSQDEMKQWGQALKGNKANPEAPHPALKIEDTAAKILLLSDAPARVRELRDDATLAQTLAQPEVSRGSNHEEEGKQSTNLPPGFKQVPRQCAGSPGVGEIHTNSNQRKEIGPSGEGEMKDSTSAVLPGALSKGKGSTTRTTRDEVMSLEESRRQR
jgi:transcriptional regulator with AAA-type ATPase domain